MKYTVLVNVKVSEEMAAWMDAQISKDLYPTRSSIMRRALAEFKERIEKPIRA